MSERYTASSAVLLVIVIIVNKVAILDASQCGIDRVAVDALKIFVETSRMTTNLSHNQLTSISDKVVGMAHVRGTLDLGFNPWRCSCDNKWMKQWVLDNRSHLSEFLRIFCYWPTWLDQKSIIQVSVLTYCFISFLKHIITI